MFAETQGNAELPSGRNLHGNCDDNLTPPWPLSLRRLVRRDLKKEHYQWPNSDILGILATSRKIAKRLSEPVRLAGSTVKVTSQAIASGPPKRDARAAKIAMGAAGPTTIAATSPRTGTAGRKRAGRGREGGPKKLRKPPLTPWGTG